MTTQLTVTSFSYFLIFCAAMTFSPGPMTLLLMGFGMQEGMQRSMAVQLGASAAYLVSILIFAVGFAELVKDHALISQVIQGVGVTYLLYLAWRQWTAGALALERPITTPHTSFEARFSKGLVTGFSNPKTMVMFGAVFPQFAGQGSHTQALDVALLGAAFLMLQFTSGCLYCYFGQRIKQQLKDPARQILLQRATALMLVAVAVMLIRAGQFY